MPEILFKVDALPYFNVLNVMVAFLVKTVFTDNFVMIANTSY